MKTKTNYKDEKIPNFKTTTIILIKMCTGKNANPSPVKNKGKFSLRLINK